MECTTHLQPSEVVLIKPQAGLWSMALFSNLKTRSPFYIRKIKQHTTKQKYWKKMMILSHFTHKLSHSVKS